MKKDDRTENAERHTLVEKLLKANPVIDDNFIKKYFSKKAMSEVIFDGKDGIAEALYMEGLSGIDCSNVDFSGLSQENYKKLPFNTKTIFPESVKDKFMNLLEEGKKFGNGYEELIHSDTFPDASNLHIAVIDLNFDDSEFPKDDINIVSHDQIDDQNCFHGKTVSSLIASKSCGMAKGANLHFYQSVDPHHKEDTSFKKIIEYNTRCENEADKIKVISGSWKLDNFETWQALLRDAGCELVCQNNFIKNFSEYVGNDEVLLDYSEEEKSELSKNAQKVLDSLELDDMVKIPIDRTYHEFDSNSDFKYQPNFSNSFGIPQIAGMFAMYKEKDNSLTFDEFCNFARETADGEKKIINPVKIYEKVLENLRTRPNGKTLQFDDIHKLTQTEEVAYEKDTFDSSMRDYEAFKKKNLERELENSTEISDDATVR